MKASPMHIVINIMHSSMKEEVDADVDDVDDDVALEMILGPDDNCTDSLSLLFLLPIICNIIIPCEFVQKSIDDRNG